MIPTFQLAMRDSKGNPGLLRVQHEDITSIEQAIQLTKNELPDSRVILVAVPKGGIYARSETLDRENRPAA